MISLPSYWVTSALSSPQLGPQTSCVRDKTSPLCSVWIPNPQSECSKMVFHMTKFWSHFYAVLITRATKHLLNKIWYIHRTKHYAAAKSLQSCQTPWTAAHQAPVSLGVSRQEHWSGLPFPSPMHACMLSRFSHVRLCATPWTAAHQAPLSTGFSRQEYWRGLPFPSPMNTILLLKRKDEVILEQSYDMTLVWFLFIFIFFQFYWDIISHYDQFVKGKNKHCTWVLWAF